MNDGIGMIIDDKQREFNQAAKDMQTRFFTAEELQMPTSRRPFGKMKRFREAFMKRCNIRVFQQDDVWRKVCASIDSAIYRQYPNPR
ncbi:unnamed protein product [Strongylus vulgaris]|uniref:Uncharacterized protein n=1 Tax=Strongylus vulgaris TaxID=40348 RepID=A0A3P7JM69_STRVU|nr:unnamed protein product [Strongylus vulgaris]